MAKPTLTIPQVTAAFGVTGMTLLTWRKGTPTREPLPCVVKDSAGGRKSVLFDEGQCTKWAKKHGLTFDVKACQTTPPGAVQAKRSKAMAAKKAS